MRQRWADLRHNPRHPTVLLGWGRCPLGPTGIGTAPAPATLLPEEPGTALVCSTSGARGINPGRAAAGPLLLWDRRLLAPAADLEHDHGSGTG